MSPQLTREKLAEGCWQIRRDGLRIGMVVGGNRRYQAQDNKGRMIANKPTRKAAEEALDKATRPKENHQ